MYVQNSDYEKHKNVGFYNFGGMMLIRKKTVKFFLVSRPTALKRLICSNKTVIQY
jgi:hypothetical protein